MNIKKGYQKHVHKTSYIDKGFNTPVQNKIKIKIFVLC